MMSFTCFSQVLKPRLLKENNDTLFVFTIPQAKIIAGIISNSQYCDSISDQQSKIILHQDTLNIFYKKQLSLLQNIIINDNAIIKNNGTEIGLLKSDLKLSEKKVRKFKGQRWLFLIGGIVTSFAIGKI